MFRTEVEQNKNEKQDQSDYKYNSNDKIKTKVNGLRRNELKNKNWIKGVNEDLSSFLVNLQDLLIK